MKNTTILLTSVSVFLLFPKLSLGQSPDFGDVANFAVFTTAGAFANVGPTIVTGDVGNNAGAFTAFPPGVLNGQIHSLNAVSALAAASLNDVNTALSLTACGTTVAPELGNNQVLTPDVYCQPGVTTLTGNLTLDAQGDPNAIFIIKVGGTFTTAASSKVILANSASLCNVFWHVTGAIVLGANSTFGGTIVGNAAVTLNDGALITGRVFTTDGAVSLTNNSVNIAVLPEASEIFASGAITFCSGGSVVLSGNSNGVWTNAESTPSITVNSSDDYFVTNSNAFCSVESNHINVTVNPLPEATAGNNIAICNGNNVTLGDIAVTGNTYAWTPTVGLSSSTIANPVASPSSTTIYTLTETITSTACSHTNSVTVTVDNVLSASVISASGPTTFCGNEYVTLSGNIGGTWSNTAAISTPTLIVNTSGDYFVINSNACNTVVSNTIITTVNPVPTAETGNDVSICIGGIAALGTTATSGHTYSWTPVTGLNVATSAHPYATPSISTIYTLTQTNTATGCSNSNSVIVTVNPLPPAITIMDATICNGQGVLIGGNSTTGNTYLWYPAIDLDSPTISNPLASPTDTITYFLTETISATGCSNSNSVTIFLDTIIHIITQPTNQAVILENSAVFSVEVAGTNLTYQWRKGSVNLVNGINISGVDTDSLIIIAVTLADTSSSYNVIVSGGCLNSATSEDAALTIVTTTGVFANMGTSETIKIFPNPFQNSINVVVNDAFQMDLEMFLFSVLGEKITHKNLSSGTNIIETTNLSKGIYIYYVKSKNEIVQHGKLVCGH